MLRRIALGSFAALFIACVGVNVSFAQDDEAKAWESFQYPEVVVVDRDNGESEGSRLVHKLIPELENFCQEIALGVCKTMYKNADEVPAFEQLTFVLEHKNGVAAKSGNPPRIQIWLSTQYLEGQYDRMGDEAITYEIAGVNWHELTHGYQYTPRGAGGYRGGTDHFGVVEGMADAVRIKAGYHKTRRARPGGHWNDGYTTTGFFLVWVNENRDPDFLYKLNQTCKTIDPWTWDKACHEIFGEETDVERLWDEYQWHLQGGGDQAVARFQPKTNFVCKGQSVEFANNSFNAPTGYKWTFEGGSPATSTKESPVVTYDKAGDYTVVLEATNEHGSTETKSEACIHVLDKTGVVTNLNELGGEIRSNSRTPAMRGEGVKNLLDGAPNTKFCIGVPSVEVEYKAAKPIELYSYAVTSANDFPGRDPKKWTLEASTDGEQWTVLDTQDEQLFRRRFETKTYVVDGDASYQYFRWSFDAKTDGTFQIADLVMYGIDDEPEGDE